LSGSRPQALLLRTQGVVFLAQFILALAFWAYSPLVDFMRRDLALTAAQIGLVPLVLDGSGLLSAPVGGWFTDRMRVRRALLLLVAGSTGGLAIMGLAPTYPLMLAGVALIGLQFSTVGPLTNRMVSLATPRRHFGLAYAVKQSSVTLAMSAWLFVSPALAVALGWQLSLLVLAGFVAAVGAWTISVLVTDTAFAAPAHGPRSRPPLAEALETLRSAWASHPMRWLFAIGFVFQGMQFTFMTFAIPLLIDVHGFTATHAAVALGVTQAAAVLTRPLVGWLSDRFGAGRRMSALAAIALGAGSSLIILATTRSTGVALATLFLGGATGFTWIGIYFARLAELWPADRLGFSTGLTLVPIKVGGMTIPALLGLLIDLYSYRVAVSLFGSLLVAGSVCLWLRTRQSSAVIVEEAVHR
jgi:predicted MFS family arabinose efflux permease